MIFKLFGVVEKVKCIAMQQNVCENVNMIIKIPSRTTKQCKPISETNLALILCIDTIFFKYIHSYEVDGPLYTVFFGEMQISIKYGLADCSHTIVRPSQKVIVSKLINFKQIYNFETEHCQQKLTVLEVFARIENLTIILEAILDIKYVAKDYCRSMIGRDDFEG